MNCTLTRTLFRIAQEIASVLRKHQTVLQHARQKTKGASLLRCFNAV